MKSLTGIVTSTKMQKTIVVNVERRWRHPIYKKIVKRSKKYLVHDEFGCKVGEHVVIEETKPTSKQKHFKVVDQIEKATKQKKKK